MGLIGGIILGVVGSFLVNEYSKEKEKEELRRKEEIEKKKQEDIRMNTPCNFLDGISKSQFNEIVFNATKHIKRLTVYIDGPIVYGVVRSQSGISEWKFTLDFNDYGKITGTCWRWQENQDSSIPKNVMKKIQDAIP